MNDRIRATYLIETAWPLDEAAAIMAGEQSSGTFVRVPGETEELRERRAARVEAIREFDAAPSPSLPGAGLPKTLTGAPVYRRAEVDVSWPFDNLGASLPNLLATVAGNLFELSPFSGLRLLDVIMPQAFRDKYQGPQFGISGTRRLAGVERLPLVGTIIKPSVGLSPGETAAIVDSLVRGGIDFIKDDELQADGPHCPFHERVASVMRVIDAHASRTGRKAMFAFNITGDIDEMLRRHDHVAASGGTCIMVSMNSIGLPAMVHLRRHSALPVHAHRNGWGMLTRAPLLGMSYVAFQKFWRLAGVDHMHVNGLRNKFCESDDSVIASARECLTPMFAGAGRGCEVMPVFSSGQWAGQAEETWKRLNSTDLIYACGGGIMAHPGGIAAGVASIRQAWDAAVAGVPLADAVRSNQELRQAVEMFAR
jgi:ribulose-bisphosphate carboxylase large chain